MELSASGTTLPPGLAVCLNAHFVDVGCAFLC